MKGSALIASGRFYELFYQSNSPYINQFISADTIVPDPANSQSWNRYSYVNNNPLRYTDPTGHMADYGGSEGGGGCSTITCFPQAPSNPPNGGSNKPIPNSSRPPIGDADLFSFSLSIGAGPWFFTFSTDYVVNEYEVEGFLSYGLGPGLGGENLPGFQDLNDFDGTFMTPQVSGTFWRGAIWGDAVAKDARNYQGTALQTGGSVGPGSVEYFSSVAQKGPLKGMPDRQVEGFAVGVGGGPLPSIPGEAHVNYANAMPVKEFTNLAKVFCGAFGCGRLRPQP